MSEEILAPWRAESSRVLIESPWIRLRAERCVTRRGAVLDPYYLIDYAEWVHVAAFDDEDRLLLVRQYRHGAKAVSLELPGGCMDPHETDAIAAGARELLEETGYAVATVSHVARLSPNPALQTNGLHLLLAFGAKPTQGQRLDATEDIVVEPTPWREAARLALAGDMIHAPHVGLLLIALAKAKGLSFG
ncbi:MAG TPA: NUDIX hydrolase [Methylocystis sp.]|nr:NUDIX hydrolase [Methylocystis sp.]